MLIGWNNRQLERVPGAALSLRTELGLRGVLALGAFDEDWASFAEAKIRV